MVKIALVGVAHIHTPFFVKSLKENDSVSVACVWDHKKERAEERATELGTVVETDLEKIWNDPSITAVVIASETNLHEKLAIAAAESGKNMFVEKPLGFSAADAKKVAEVVKKNSVIFQTGYFMRGSSIHQYLKSLVDSGAFGEITRVRHANCHRGTMMGYFDGQWGWMADPSIAGCGAFGDLGTHSLDILMWLFGRPEKVTGFVRSVSGKYGDDCDESGEALLLFPKGIIATLAGGWVDQANTVTCEISGTKLNAVVINGELFLKGDELEGADGTKAWSELPPAVPHAFLLFLDAICGKTPALDLVDVRDAADRSIVMEAIYKAAKNTAWETVDYGA